MIFSRTSRILLVLQCVAAFAPLSQRQRLQQLQLDAAKIGIFFGTSTGSTETVADLLKEEIGDDADGPFDIETLEGSVASNFEKYSALIVGTPTWNTGADIERSGTGWVSLSTASTVSFVPVRFCIVQPNNFLSCTSKPLM